MIICPDLQTLQTPAGTTTIWSDHARGTAVAALGIATKIGQDQAVAFVSTIATLLSQDLQDQGIDNESIAAVLKRWGAFVAGEVTRLRRAQMN
ncbi:MAG: hypothetical protein ACOYB3_05475 [Azonexus sp.]